MKHDEVDVLCEVINKLDEVVEQLHVLVNEIVKKKAKVDNTPVDEAFLDCRIQDIDFGGSTGRIRNTCLYNGDYSTGNWVDKPIVTVRDLIVFTEAEMMRKANFGRISLNRIKAVLAAHGLKFKGKEQHNVR